MSDCNCNKNSGGVTFWGSVGRTVTAWAIIGLLAAIADAIFG